ncbi:hypothetical protein VTP01DRAFT_3518 [Rhizomucor pusillus]|uniref:uncharacterized protein n=1 Tax=Rhizomucor pusillus TaxID=4840 RepID=UPI003743ADE7
MYQRWVTLDQTRGYPKDIDFEKIPQRYKVSSQAHEELKRNANKPMMVNCFERHLRIRFSPMQLAASKPQTPELFLQEVLVPEAACLLIQEDLEQSKGYSIDI